MTKKSTDQLPEVLVSNANIAKKIQYYLKEKRIRKIASRLYTKNFEDLDETIVKRNIWQIVDQFFPNAMIADRTALENKPAKDGSIFVISSKKRDIILPGFVIRPRKGGQILSTDYPFIGSLYITSQARSFLENMKASRSINNAVTRTLAQKEIESQLSNLYLRGGDKALNQLRDQAKEVSKQLQLEKEYQILKQLIGSFLGTQTYDLKTKLALDISSGAAFDIKRIDLFQNLYQTLKNTAPILRSSTLKTSQEKMHFSFFEAYFSNFIEGTEFEIEEAQHIIFDGKIPRERPADAHDILGTYKVITDPQYIKETPTSFEHFLELLKQKHTFIMGGRSDKNPGQFKSQLNRAGETVFVAPDLMIGTLKKGYEYYQAFEMGFQKAVFIMFLIAEVHPFLDGNGRLARVMMNAELSKINEQRILIPTIYRNNYLSALRALSLNNIATPLIRVLDFAQKYSSSIQFDHLENAQNLLKETNAFVDANYADENGLRLYLGRL